MKQFKNVKTSMQKLNESDFFFLFSKIRIQLSFTKVIPWIYTVPFLKSNEANAFFSVTLKFKHNILKMNIRYSWMCLVIKLIVIKVQCQDNRISRYRGNILRNLTGTHEYENNIVTSQLDASQDIRRLYRMLRDVYNRYVNWYT